MFKTNAFQENHRYLEPAAQAAALEREGHYTQAADYWNVARQNANTFENQDYARNREAFCRNFGRRVELEACAQKLAAAAAKAA
ncbi:ANR family transcriptional regulator [Shewanella yunxiaonensis]|uniref:ANR family transcriptional regulator n=1 Tax=Shewanella yunxiaonensis TaxID=2829809 RepID=A0ABX7YUW2_9GAMM|nr:ANR family transcriptional regulator [Shewanella yunxiaonensis]QUN06457.1 ANR family transcriptional regulator [Shewanella yunxiaonensis]